MRNTTPATEARQATTSPISVVHFRPALGGHREKCSLEVWLLTGLSYHQVRYMYDIIAVSLITTDGYSFFCIIRSGTCMVS